MGPRRRNEVYEHRFPFNHVAHAYRILSCSEQGFHCVSLFGPHIAGRADPSLPEIQCLDARDLGAPAWGCRAVQTYIAFGSGLRRNKQELYVVY